MKKNIYRTFRKCTNVLPKAPLLIPLSRRGSFVLLFLFGLLLATQAVAQTCIQVSSPCANVESGQYVKSGSTFYSSTGNSTMRYGSGLWEVIYYEGNTRIVVATATSSSTTIPPPSGWIYTGSTCGAESTPMALTVSQGDCVPTGPCYTVSTTCGTIGGTYRDIGQKYNGKPDVYDEDGNDIYWGGQNGLSTILPKEAVFSETRVPQIRLQ